MNRQLPILFLLLLLASSGKTQIGKNKSVDARPMPDGFETLVLPGKVIYKDIILSEKQVNLIKAETTFPVIKKATQRLDIPIGGWVIDKIAKKNWTALDTNKRKFIGTSTRSMKMYQGIRKEYDYNIFLSPHLPEQVKMIRYGLDQSLARHRNDKHYKIEHPPFACAEELEFKGGCFSVECENTPDEDLIPMLDSVFIATGEGEHPYAQQKNFGMDYPSIGMYGVFCLDCNHNCRPEIHPFEWLWWSKADTVSADSFSKRTWFAGLFNDCSHRFKDWAPGPVTGKISIPFVIPKNKATLEITIEHLIYDTTKISTQPPSEFFKRSETYYTLLKNRKFYQLLETDKGGQFNIYVTEKNKPLQEHDRVEGWIDELGYDEKNNVLFGYLNIAVAASTTHTMKITVESK